MQGGIAKAPPKAGPKKAPAKKSSAQIAAAAAAEAKARAAKKSKQKDKSKFNQVGGQCPALLPMLAHPLHCPSLCHNLPAGGLTMPICTASADASCCLTLRQAITEERICVFCRPPQDDTVFHLLALGPSRNDAGM